tara:strand:- start:13378 stop:13554 length:177 start_codon:yes stop_codon:yes gene_type:complete
MGFIEECSLLFRLERLVGLNRVEWNLKMEMLFLVWQLKPQRIGEKLGGEALLRAKQNS